MPYHTPELRAQEVWRHAQDLLEEQLPLKAEGYIGNLNERCRHAALLALRLCSATLRTSGIRPRSC